MYLGPRHISWPMAQLHNGVLLFLMEQSDHQKQWAPSTGGPLLTLFSETLEKQPCK